MTPRFFGQYLVAVGAITADELAAATHYLVTRNLTLGARAVAAGYLNEEQVRMVTHLQRTVDCKWGELCLTLGLLEPGQLETLLSEQRAQSMRIGEAVVANGFLTAEARDLHLAQFLESELSQNVPAAGTPQVPEEANNVASLVERLALRTAGMHLKRGSTSAWSTEQSRDVTAAIAVESGSLGTLICLTLDQTLANHLAAGLLGIQADELEPDMVMDGVCEFLNILGGHCKNVRQIEGEQVRLGLPRANQGPTSGLAYALEGTHGRGALVLNIESASQIVAEAA